MNQPAQQNQVAPIVQFKRDLQTALDRGEFALPSTVDPGAFKNAAIIAYQGEQELDKCTPQSVFKALRVLAGAGLVPDGREAAIVKFGNIATAMPMVFGLIKVARNSGQVKALYANVVYEGEILSTSISDTGMPKFDHVKANGNPIDAMDRGGEVRGAYAVAVLADGTIDFQPMSKEEIEKRRKASKTQKSDKPTGIWGQWYEEMAKKTVIRNLAKRLPMSTEDINRLMKEQDAPVLRDVTPEPEANHVPLSQRLREEPEAEEPKQVDGEVMDPDPPSFDDSQVFPGSDAYTEGVKASRAALKESMNPNEPGSEDWHNWIGGFRFAEANKDKS